jgi:CspA family cold shock protein
MSTGTVNWISADKGFSLITQDTGGDDVFAHHSAINSAGFRTLEQNQRVKFDVVQEPKGLRAVNIRPL